MACSHLINTSKSYQTVECNQKIIQFIPHVISTAEVEVCNLTPEEFYTEKRLVVVTAGREVLACSKKEA